MAGHEYHALIHWARAAALFTDNRYSRAHTGRFDGGIEVPPSAFPKVRIIANAVKSEMRIERVAGA